MFVIRENKARLVRPTLGVTVDDWIAVESGIHEGDAVATSGHATITDGADVQVVTGAVRGREP